MTRTRSRRALLGLLVVAFSALAAAVTYAGLAGTTSNPGNSISVGSIALSDNDSGSAMLSLNQAPGGTTDTSCINVTSTGTLPARVRQYASVSGTLGPYLTLTVTRGTGASSFDSCSGFAPDSVNYYGAGAGVLYRGAISGLPSTWAAGIVDPADQDHAGSTYPSAVLADAGLVSYWRLGDVKLGDSFTGTAGTLLPSHTADSTATWTKLTALPDDLVLTDANRLRENGSGGGVAYSSAVPASADYQVGADVVVKSKLVGDAAGVVGRLDTTNANGTYYLARYRAAQWELVKRVNGVETILGTYADRLVAGTSYRLRLDLQGTAIRVYVDGILRISATDGAISAAGRAGVQVGYAGSTVTQTNATGLHLDNLRLVDSSAPTTARDAKGTNSQAYVNGPTLTTGALGGDGDRAASFDGVNDYVNVTRQIQDSFSIELWFKSTQGLNTNAQWWGNAGLVDGEVGGTSNDFGVSLRSDGKITAGVGNPDQSIVSSSGGYNDGVWHHVVFTRDKTTGALALYVDGASAGTLTATNKNSLTGPASLSFGRIQTGGNYYAGALDEVAVYNRVLSAADVQAHFDGVRSAPETWTSGESHSYRFDLALTTDPTSTGKSASATFTWEAQGP